MNNKKRRLSVSDLDNYKRCKDNISELGESFHSDGYSYEFNNNSFSNFEELRHQDLRHDVQNDDSNVMIQNELIKRSSSYARVKKSYLHSCFNGKLGQKKIDQEYYEFLINKKSSMKHMRNRIKKTLTKSDDQGSLDYDVNKSLTQRSFSQISTKRGFKAKSALNNLYKSNLYILPFTDALKEINKKLFESSNEENREGLIDCLEYLKSKIIISHFCVNKKDRFFDQNKTCLDIINLYFRKSGYEKEACSQVFDKKCTNRLLEQLVFKNASEIDTIIEAIKHCININIDSYAMFIMKCVNLTISYTHLNIQKCGIIGVVDILHYIAVKVRITNGTKMIIFRHCVLELTAKELLDYINFDQFTRFVATFYVDEKKIVADVSIYIHKNFETANTSTKLLLMLILKHLIENSDHLDQLIPVFTNIANTCLLSQNYRLIELLTEIFISRKGLNQLKDHCELILPTIFSKLYHLTKTYWYAKGKIQVLLMFKKLMQGDSDLFISCLKKYNIDKTMDNLKKFDEEYTKQMFQFLSISDKHDIPKESMLDDDGCHEPDCK